MKYYKTRHSFNVERDGLSSRLAPFKLPELNCTFGLESELREIAHKGLVVLITFHNLENLKLCMFTQRLAGKAPTLLYQTD